MRNQVNIGDVFYRIEPVDAHYFYSACRVCKGEKSLTVNGVTFKCPMCNQEEKTLTVRGFEVRALKVYSIEQIASLNYWKLDGDIKRSFGLFAKRSKGLFNPSSISNDDFTARANEQSLTENLNKTDFLKKNSVQTMTQFHVFLGSAFFDDFDLAVQTAEKLAEIQQRVLDEFNAEHGTSYEMPVFKIRHEKKK